MDPAPDASASPPDADDARAATADRDQRVFALGTLLLCAVVWWWWPGFAARFAEAGAQVEGGTTSGERLALGSALAHTAAAAGGLVLLSQLLPWRRLRGGLVMAAAVVVLGAVLWGWDTLATLVVRHMQAQVEATEAPTPGG